MTFPPLGPNDWAMSWVDPAQAIYTVSDVRSQHFERDSQYAPCSEMVSKACPILS